MPLPLPDIMVIDQGQIKYQGDISKGIDYYFSLSPTSGSSIKGAGKARILNLTLSSNNDTYSNLDIFKIKYLDTLNLDILFSLDPSIQEADMNISFFDKECNHVSVSRSALCNFKIFNNASEIKLRVKFPNIQLGPGMYSIAVKIINEGIGEVLLNYHNIKNFQVTGEFSVPSSFDLESEWSYV